MKNTTNATEADVPTTAERLGEMYELMQALGGETQEVINQSSTYENPKHKEKELAEVKDLMILHIIDICKRQQVEIDAMQDILNGLDI